MGLDMAAILRRRLKEKPTITRRKPRPERRGARSVIVIVAWADAGDEVGERLGQGEDVARRLDPAVGELFARILKGISQLHLACASG
jgi:hypothetical protein